jgi:uncharacterized repeat protein (TIGR01451 family)
MSRKIMRVSVMVMLPIFLGIVPTPVYANLPKLTVNFQAMDVTTNSGWQSPISANAGDKIRFRAILTNIGDATATDVHIQMPLYQSFSMVQYPSFHIRALNAGVPDPVVKVSLSNTAMPITYVPGSAYYTVNGATRNISPDSASQNITTQEILIGNVQTGDSNAVTIYYDTTLTASANVTPEPTAVPKAGNATASAVANSTPQTGVGDSMAWTTAGWLVVGAAGICLRKWSERILV